MFNKDAFFNHHAVNARTGFDYRKNIYDGYVTDAEGKQWGWISTMNLYEQPETGIQKSPAQFQLMNIDILGYSSNDGGPPGEGRNILFQFTRNSLVYGQFTVTAHASNTFTLTALANSYYTRGFNTRHQSPDSPSSDHLEIDSALQATLQVGGDAFAGQLTLKEEGTTADFAQYKDEFTGLPSGDKSIRFYVPENGIDFTLPLNDPGTPTISGVTAQILQGFVEIGTAGDEIFTQLHSVLGTGDTVYFQVGLNLT